MATPRKVQEYLIATEVAKNYLETMRSLLEQTSLDMLSKGDQNGASKVQQRLRIYGRIQNDLLDLMARLYGELFTDEDLEQLIAIYRMPVSKKIRLSIPSIQREFLDFLERLDIERLVREDIK